MTPRKLVLARPGFTIAELLVVMGIAAILWAIATLALIRPQQKVSLDGAVSTLVADIKAQQTRAMSGDSSASDFGIYFETHSYTLFTGSVYSSLDPNNFVVNVDDPIQISNITAPTLILQKGSGEPLGGQSNLTFSNSGGEATNLTINKYGAISQN